MTIFSRSRRSANLPKNEPKPLRNSFSGKPSSRANRKNLTYQVLEPRQLLANLSIADAFVSNGIDTPKEPVIGERVWVTSDIATEDLAVDAEYSIEVHINGIKLETNGLTGGAGEAIDRFLETGGGWFVEPGTNVGEVWIDSLDEIAETDETDNYFRFEFQSQSPNLSEKFLWPFGGEAWQDYVGVTYPDVNPDNGGVDHRGFSNGADGAISFEVGLASNQGVDQGIPIYAIADGTVGYTVNGENDRYIPGSSGDRNWLRINHEGSRNITSLYSGIRRDSMQFEVGDEVARSSVIVGIDGTYINPFIADGEVYWESQPAYPHDNSTVARSWVSNVGWGFQINEGPSEFRTFLQGESSPVLIGARVNGVEKDEVVAFEWRRPDGTLFYDSSDTQQFTRLYGDFSSNTTLPSDAELGEWTISIIADGVVQKVETFEVVEEIYAAIRVEESTELIGNPTSEKRLVTDGRYSPYNLGAANLSEQSEQYEFEVTNYGTDTLYVFLVETPEGFIHSELPDMLFPGESSTFTVELDTNDPGYRIGEVRIHTSDPNHGIFVFSVEGAVLDANSAFDPGYMTIGMIERNVVEGGSLLANVRIPEDTSTPLTIALDYSYEFVTGPAFVTIPAGSNQVLFEVNVADDNIEFADRFVSVNATYANLDSPNFASYNLRIVDSAAVSAGTENDDVVRLTLGERITSQLNNGEAVDITNAGESPRVFDALGGNDRLIIVDHFGDDVVIATSELVSIAGDFGFEGRGFETVEVESLPGVGQGLDVAELHGAPGADLRFMAGGEQETLVDDVVYSFSITGFDETRAFANSAASSFAEFSDTPADETFYATPELAFFGREGKKVAARGFDKSFARSTAGGNDLALLIGSDEIDDIFSNLTFSGLTGDTYQMDVSGFKTVIARAGGGEDRATLVGSEADEKFYANQQYGAMRSGDQFRRIDSAEDLTMSSGGGEDRAILQDGDGDETFFSSPTSARLYNAQRSIRASNFPNVVALSSNGNDKAIFSDSDGIDRFVARPNAAWLTGTGFFNHSIGFGQVFSTGNSGGDEAILFGSVADEEIYTDSFSTIVQGADYFNQTSGFKKTSLIMWQGGADNVVLKDSAEDDTLVGSNFQASFSNNSYTVSMLGLERLVAHSENGGNDVLVKNSLNFELVEIGNWN
jgi:hypothetical protein